MVFVSMMCQAFFTAVALFTPPHIPASFLAVSFIFLRTIGDQLGEDVVCPLAQPKNAKQLVSWASPKPFFY